MDKIKLRNDYGDDGHYEPSDSEEDYSEGERELLQEVRKGRVRDQSKQKEVLAFTESEDEDEKVEADGQENGDGEDDDDDDDDMGLADSDIEGAEQNDDDLPDTKYWGKKSSAYYNTDFVDQDYSTYNEKEEELAKLEEAEAKAIQLRLAKQLKEEDFVLDSAVKKSKKMKKIAASDETEKSTLLKADFSGLSKRERLELFEKDSPEFAGLIGDFEGYLEEIQQLHDPVLRYVRDNNVPMIPALQFAQHYQNIALTYCSNLAFYLLLKAKRSSIQNHPIIQRLTQLKKLLQQLDDKHENIIKPQLEALLERIQDGDEFEVLEKARPAPEEPTRKTSKRPTKTKLGILSAYDETATTEEPSKKKKKLPKDEKEDDDVKDLSALAAMSSDDNDDDADEMGEEEGDYEEGEDGESRRAITYQISKNKGLMPHRKKEQRNPRVKHRGKYRKALIRRKGAVRTVRKETSRYGGEVSGIKATVSKSVKFRS